ncbi:MAG: hypothetical protein R3B48_14200 [Kofleriaceae bacterium]
MSELPPALPPVQQVVLDAAAVARLFDDIERAGEWLGASAKGARRGAPASSFASLAEAKAALLGGAVAGVQLRYRFAGEEWWDTLMPTATGIRLVRISHTRALAVDPA